MGVWVYMYVCGGLFFMCVFKSVCGSAYVCVCVCVCLCVWASACVCVFVCYCVSLRVMKLGSFVFIIDIGE